MKVEKKTTDRGSSRKGGEDGVGIDLTQALDKTGKSGSVIITHVPLHVSF